MKRKAAERDVTKSDEGSHPWYAVAVGESPGTYATLREARAAVGTHPAALCVVKPTRDAAVEYVTAFQPRMGKPGTPVHVVYTDGACQFNGQKGAVAGVGVFWGRDDPRNVSRRVRGPDTNNNAELEAVEDALDAIAAEPAESTDAAEYVIVTDSKYVFDSVTKYCPKWDAAGWNRYSTAGKFLGPVLNQDLMRRVYAKYTAATPRVRLVHVPAHAGHFGNVQADALAVAGRS